MMTPPVRRALTDDAVEKSRQVGLIGEPDLRRDIGKRLVREEHDLLRPFDPAADDISIGRLTEIAVERPRELPGAEMRDRGEFLDADRLGEVRFDEFEYASRLPGRQVELPIERFNGFPMLVGFPALYLGIEKVGGPDDEMPGLLNVPGKSLLGRVEKLREHGRRNIRILRPHESMLRARRFVGVVTGHAGGEAGIADMLGRNC